MKFTLFMATSANGLIANKDYSEDFFSDYVWNYSLDLYKNYSCIIWGRKTYEIVSGWEEKYLQPIKNFPKIIISSNSNIDLQPNDHQFSSPELALQYLAKQNYSKVLLSGGSINNSSFAKLKLIDEVIFLLDSIIIGEGIPLFNPADFLLNLELIKATPVNNHLVSLHYKVIK